MLFGQLDLLDTVIVTAVEPGRSDLVPGFQRYLYLYCTTVLYNTTVGKK